MAESGIAKSQVDGRRKRSKQEQCEMCQERQAIGYCSQCEMYICQSCFDRHRRSRQCRNHVLLDAQDSSETTDYYETCIEHDHQPIKFYCSQHKFFGCGECICIGHKKCKYEHISEASRRFKESGGLDRLFEEIQSLECSHKEFIDAINEQIETNSSMNNSAENNIESFAESLLTYASEAKKIALDKARSKGLTNNQQIDKMNDDVEAIGSQLDEVTAAFKNEERINKLFMLAVESNPKVAAIRNIVSTFNSKVITEFSFQPSKILKDFATNARPLGRCTETGQDDEHDLETKLKKEQERADMLSKQLEAQREETENALTKNRRLQKKNAEKERTINDQMKTFNAMKLKHETEMSTKTEKINDLESKLKGMKLEMQKLEGKYSELKAKFPEITLLCGHSSLLQLMNRRRNRTIRCGVCNITYGDQPDGLFETTIEDYFRNTYHRITMKFPKGTQSQLNVKPGEAYENMEFTCYLANDDEGNALLKMLNVAFQRRLIFTINYHGKIVPGVIELFSEIPYHRVPQKYTDIVGFWTPRYEQYVKRVKKQLAAVGITN